MPVVQTFEETLDTDERLAALAAAMNRLPAEAVVRRPSTTDAAIARADPARVDPARADSAQITPAGRPAPDSPAPSTPARTPAPFGASSGATTSGAAAIPDTGPVSIPVPEPLAGLLPGGLRRGEA